MTAPTVAPATFTSPVAFTAAADAVTATSLVLCPTCTQPVRGLLAGCYEPTCVSADIADDAAFERSLDV